MDFVSVNEKANEWDISLRRVQQYCEQGRIDGVRRLGKIWLIPKTTPRPPDLRCSINKNMKNDEQNE